MNKNLTKITKNVLVALPLVVMSLLTNISNAQTANPITAKFTSAPSINFIGTAAVPAGPGGVPAAIPATGWNLTQSTFPVLPSTSTPSGLNSLSEWIQLHYSASWGVNIQRKWDFGDGTFYVEPYSAAATLAQGQNLVIGHEYKYAGTYTATLTVSDLITGTANQDQVTFTTNGVNPIPTTTVPILYGPYLTNNSYSFTLISTSTVDFGNLSAHLWTIKANGVTLQYDLNASGTHLDPSPNGNGSSTLSSLYASPGVNVTYTVSDLTAQNPTITIDQTSATTITIVATDLVTGNTSVTTTAPSTSTTASINTVLNPSSSLAIASVGIQFNHIYDITSDPSKIFPIGTIETGLPVGGETYVLESANNNCSSTLDISAPLFLASDGSSISSLNTTTYNNYTVTLILGDGNSVVKEIVTGGDQPFATSGSGGTPGYTYIYNYPGTYTVYYILKDSKGNVIVQTPQVQVVSLNGKVATVSATASNTDFTVNGNDAATLNAAGNDLTINAASGLLSDTKATINLQAKTSNLVYVWDIQRALPTGIAPASLATDYIPDFSTFNASSAINNQSNGLTISRGGLASDGTVASNSSQVSSDIEAAYPTATILPSIPYKVKLTVYPVVSDATQCFPSISTNSASRFLNVYVPIIDGAIVGGSSVGKITTYPNPVVDAVNINTTLKNASSYVVVAVYDMAGNIKLSSKVSAANNVANTVLNVSHLTTGFYKVTVTNAEGQLVQTKSIFKN